MYQTAKAALLGISLALVLTCAQQVGAAPLPTPDGKPILRISGDIAEKNSVDAAVFDRSMLEKLGMTIIQTNTPWYTGPVKFEGVPFDKLMANVGAKGGRIVVYALNDYMTEIPIEDLVKHHAILALKRDGQYMPVSDKGPLFIVYPYDSDPELQSQVYYGRSAWQVAKIVVKP